jgi:hypothetical protein
MHDVTTSYLTVEDAYLSPIERPAEISVHYPIAVIAKVDLSFVLALDVDELLRRDQRYGSYLAPEMQKVNVTLPFFRVSGYLRLPSRVSPRDFLASQSDNYFLMVETTARLTSNTEITYEAEAALINTVRISFMGLDNP